MEKLIITAAVCGSQPTKEQNPAVPYTPAEIADQALDAWRAGAAIAHIHVRHPETGAPDSRAELFAEVLQRIRAASDLIVNLTTSGLNLTGPDAGQQRLEPVALKPDICSLDVGSLNFGHRVFLNPPDWVKDAARAMQQAGVKPEIEVFDLGHIRQAQHLIQQELITTPPWIQLCLGIPWGIEGSLEALLAMRDRLPDGAVWSVLAPGPLQLPLTTHALLLGGHVRVGFEDNLYLQRGVKASSNAQFVERTTKLAHTLLRPVASCAEARQILGLPPASAP
ncbi:MAG: 3-keto-5-aminohexanoate cleavage protein [Candidatus Latescibacteria bacterium]|nr:3-keto-5-aminohexanoate cleavage protein [Candidatus Latescibacterota bacterium]